MKNYFYKNKNTLYVYNTLDITHSQEIHCNVYCHKGIGRTHAKFSPVGL